MGDNTYKHKIVHEGYHLKIPNSVVLTVCVNAGLNVYTDYLIFPYKHSRKWIPVSSPSHVEN